MYGVICVGGSEGVGARAGVYAVLLSTEVGGVCLGSGWLRLRMSHRV